MNIMAASLAEVVICQKSKKHCGCQEKLAISATFSLFFDYRITETRTV